MHGAYKVKTTNVIILFNYCAITSASVLPKDSLRFRPIIILGSWYENLLKKWIEEVVQQIPVYGMQETDRSAYSV